jgi:two-component system sensor histidine kinase ChvG
VAESSGRVVAHPRIRRRLRVIALGLVLLPTLALAFLVGAVLEADRDARLREQRERQRALERRARDLAGRLGAQEELFPAQDREHFALRAAAPPLDLSRPVRIDASCADWVAADGGAAPCASALVHFGREGLLDAAALGYDPRDLSFSILTGTRERQLFLFLRVFDDELRFRERRLDEGDQLHLLASLPGPGGASLPLRFVVALEPGPEGAVTTHQVERSWSEPVPPEARLAWGQPELPPSRRPLGRWRETPEGYAIELRLPLASLGARWREAELGLAVVDVDRSPGARSGLRRQAMWALPQREGAFALEAPDARAFRRAWREAGLGRGMRRLALFDARGRELLASFAPGPETRAQVLDGLDAWLRGAPLSPARGEEGLASARIVSPRDAVLGFVFEQDMPGASRSRLAAALPQTPVTAAVLAGALALLFLLLAYTSRLSRRILALVDDVGRERGADDEIGELSRRLSDLIERDRAHRDYLEQLPRVLAHETSNPLGVVKMFVDEPPEGERCEQKRRQASARRAIRSIEDLIEDLREATSLEEALERGERVELDLVEQVAEYASAYREQSGAALEVSLPARGFHTRVIEGRIEQLLDKLLDNAVDFSEGAPVRIGVEADAGQARIRVENRGPALPEGPGVEQLFAPMRSGRRRGGERHPGLGLYVARLIARHHGGGIRAWNAPPDRVVFEVTLRGAQA